MSSFKIEFLKKKSSLALPILKKTYFLFKRKEEKYPQNPQTVPKL